MFLSRVSTVLACIFFKCCSVYSRPVDTNGEADPLNINAKSLQFLWDKGYLGATHRGAGQLRNKQQLVQGLKRFQEFVGIPVSGKLDSLTMEYMQKPRCGMPDIIRDERRRKKRFSLQGSKWVNTRLTWALETRNNDFIPSVEVRRVLRESFARWEAVTNIYFREIVGEPPDTAMVRVRFVHGRHGDPYPFDGYGGTLAHAFYPMNNEGLAGDVHFDDAERFTVKPNASRHEKKLNWVAVHEIGHTIGLDHSDVQEAIMYPYYKHFSGNDFNLAYDDIIGAQSIYGGKDPPKPSTTLRPTKRPSLRPTRPTQPHVPGCTDRIKAAVLGNDRKLHVINDDQYYILHTAKEGVEKGPLSVSDQFKGISRVDSVFRRLNDRYFVVFHGDEFSVYDEMRLVTPARKIKYGFQNTEVELRDIDAAFVWPYNKKLYIFKGENYWRMSQLPSADYVVDFGYPQLIAAKWGGLPKTIDSVFQWSNGKIYFTKDKSYYRWDERRQKVHSGYPIKLTRSFLKCNRS